MSEDRRMIKVLGFDGWTQGIHHFARLSQAFAESNITLSVVHLGSWGEDKDRPLTEVLQGVAVQDIRAFCPSTYNGVLDAIKPDLVLFLSCHTFLHRAFRRYCKQRNIPTMLLYHALMRVVPYTRGKRAYKISTLGQLRYLGKQAGRILTRAVPVYAASLYNTGGTIKDWGRFGIDLVSRVRGELVYPAPPDARCDAVCVYTEGDAVDPMDRFGHTRNEVYVVGNPDISRFSLTTESLGMRRGFEETSQREVLYIDSGFSSNALLFDSHQSYLKFLLDCSARIGKAGGSMLVKLKPHPPSRYNYLASELASAGIDIVKNEDLLSTLSCVRCCIAEPSTLSLIPALCGLPVHFVQFGPAKGLEYGEVFTSYPRGRFLTSWDMLDTVMNAPDRFDPQELNSWLAVNAGPLPAEWMPARVADAVREAVRQFTESKHHASHAHDE